MSNDTAEKVRAWVRSHTVAQGNCLIVIGVRYSQYAKMSIDGVMYSAHTASFEAFKGPLKPGEIVRHKCDRKPCINPDCLVSGSHTDNNNDMYSRNRGPSGERHWKSTLLTSDVLLIRKDPRTHSSIAADYGVSKSCVTAIKTGRTRKHE